MRLFDMHCDTLYECYISKQSLLKNTLHLDLVRGQKYDDWVQAFAIWMPDKLRGEQAFKQCLKILDFAHNQVDKNKDLIKIVYTKQDMEKAIQNHQCAAILTIEGGSALAGKLENLNILKDHGVKLITLTWNGANELGYGSASGCSEGLTKLGKQAVKRMEKLHIIPDVSHLNEKGFWEVMDNTQEAVIASHSLSAAINSHPRNLTDEQFCAIRDRGGVVGLNLCADHLGKQTYECLERHLDHYLSMDGEKTVAFGCDLDGTNLPADWGGIDVMKSIYNYLQHKNYEDALLDGIFFSNCYNFFSKQFLSFDN